MNRKASSTTRNAIRTAMGIAFVSGTIAAPVTAVADNPFVANDLGSGYQLASNHAEGKCGEGKCGGSADKPAEGKCGEGKCGASGEKSAEGKCGASGEKSAEGKCGASGEKSAEGKCGEGKCGG